MALVKAIGQTAPAHILRQYRLFLLGGKAVLSFQLFQQTDGPDIVVEPCPRRPHADGVIGNVVLMPVCAGDFGMKDKGGHLGSASGRGRGLDWPITIMAVPIR